MSNISAVITYNLLLCHQSILTTTIFILPLSVIIAPFIDFGTNKECSLTSVFIQVNSLSSSLKFPFLDPFRAHLVCLLQHYGALQSLVGCFAYLGWDRMNSQPLESKSWYNYERIEDFLLQSLALLLCHFWCQKWVFRAPLFGL